MLLFISKSHCEPQNSCLLPFKCLCCDLKGRPHRERFLFHSGSVQPSCPNGMPQTAGSHRSIFSQCRRLESKIQVAADPVPGEAPLTGLQTIAFTLWPRVASLQIQVVTETSLPLVTSFSHNSFPACMLTKLTGFSCDQLSATVWTVAHQAPLSMGVSRKESWSGLPCPPPGDLPDPRMEPGLLCLLHWQLASLPLSPLGKLILSLVSPSKNSHAAA